MSKQGVSSISGNTSPKVGEAVTYTVTGWYAGTPQNLRNPANVTWELFKKRSNGRFTTTNIKKTGNGTFTFGEVAQKHTYRLEAYLFEPEGSGPSTLDINPQPEVVPKIDKVELQYVDDTPGEVFSYTEKMRARAQCVNLNGEKLRFTLWEDDASGSGHNSNNLLIETKEAQVDQTGVAVAEFMLTRVLMEKAMQGETDAQKLEFYVTVEYFSHNKHATNNVDVDNPLYVPPVRPQPRPETIQPAPESQPAENTVPPRAENSPAAEKPESQMEQSGVSPSPANPNEELHDYQEAQGTIEPDQTPTVETPEGTTESMVENSSAEEVIDAFFAKEEFTAKTNEDGGDHTYTFGGRKANNQTGTAAQKEGVADTILKNVEQKLKGEKKYTTKELIVEALTANEYGTDAENKTVAFKTFKLGPELKKITSAPLGDKLYLVAKTAGFALNDTEATIIMKEKDGLIKGAPDAVLPALQLTEQEMSSSENDNTDPVPGEEKNEFKGTMKSGLVKIPIRLRPKTPEDLAEWQQKISKGKEDGKHTYTPASSFTVDNETEHNDISARIVEKVNKELGSEHKIYVDDVKKLLVADGQTRYTEVKDIPKFKKIPELLYLNVKAQGEEDHDKEFLKKDGEYFEIGHKCPRCEEDLTLKHIEDLFGVHRASTAFRTEVVQYLNQYIKQRRSTDKPIHINTCLRKAHFFAQVGAETSGINTDWIVETDVIPYAPANIRNTAIFGNRSGILERRGQIETFCAERPQKKLLSFLYANEYGKGNGNGNEESGDGYKFRGRGLKQLTGRDNYRNASLKLKEIFPEEYIDLEANPDKVKEAKYAVLSAIAYWENNEVWKVADEIKTSNEENIKKIRRTVNGATAGWKDAKKYFEKGIEVFRVNECSPVESSGEWHDPVNNPMLCLYSQGGSLKPWHGSFGPQIRDGVNKHTGMDLFAKPGTNVYACVKGKVVRSEVNSSLFGELIVVEVTDVEVIKKRRKNPFTLKYSDKTEIESQNFNHDGPFYLLYAHLSERKVSVGDGVNAGTVIGLSGTSGNGGVPFSTKNPHVHFEILNIERGAGLNNKCNPGVYLTYKDEDSLTESDRAEQDDAKNNSIYWTQ